MSFAITLGPIALDYAVVFQVGEVSFVWGTDSKDSAAKVSTLGHASFGQSGNQVCE